MKERGCGEQKAGVGCVTTHPVRLDAPSGFEWLPFNKPELQFYNIRHIQHHTGELCERLGVMGEIEVPWIGTKSE